MNRRHALKGVSAALAAASLLSVNAYAADTIKIGTFGALTGPGYLYGKLPMNGIEVVFDEVNAAGGINGRKLQLISYDSAGDAEKARTPQAISSELCTRKT